jgi:hypothetical protein
MVPGSVLVSSDRRQAVASRAAGGPDAFGPAGNYDGGSQDECQHRESRTADLIDGQFARSRL